MDGMVPNWMVVAPLAAGLGLVAAALDAGLAGALPDGALPDAGPAEAGALVDTALGLAPALDALAAAGALLEAGAAAGTLLAGAAAPPPHAVNNAPSSTAGREIEPQAFIVTPPQSCWCTTIHHARCAGSEC